MDQNTTLSQKPDFIAKYLHKLDWQVNENANMSYSLQGMRNYISNEVTKDYWLQNIYPPEIAESHKSGDFHIHDLGELNSYCVGWDLQDLLKKGFGGVEGKVHCDPPKHLSSALGQLVNFFYTMQGESAGAQAVSSFDTLLAPFVFYDHLSFAQVKQEIQSFVYNMNIPTRVGFQTPFTNITLDLTCPKTYSQEPAIVGGKLMDKTYGQFQTQMDMINRAFAEVMLEGDSHGRVFTFPIPTYNITQDFHWEDENLDAVWEMTAKYGIPYFANYVNSEMKPEDARSMCCRLRLDNRQLQRRGGGLFGSSPLTGSIGVVTLNLPRIGYLSESKIELFARLNRLLDLAKKSLEIKREIVEELTEKNLYPYSKFFLSSVKQRFNKYWSNHFSTVGILGMNEMLLNFTGENITTENGQILAEEILEHIRDRIFHFQEETDNLYNLEATPAEGTSYRLALLDQQQYPDIVFANTNLFSNHTKSDFSKVGLSMNDNGLSKLENNFSKNQNQSALRSETGLISVPYYTNSSQLPVGFTEDIFEALDMQDSLQTKYTGGTVLHGFLGEKISDIKTTKKLIKTIAENYHLPYFSLTPTFSICKNHGYLAGEHFYCPDCGAKCEVYSRIVGYIRPVDQWNRGKKEEFTDRKEYKVPA